jgi:hypothetical protein
VVAAQRREGRQMPAGGVPHHDDLARRDAGVAGLVHREADRAEHVGDRLRKMRAGFDRPMGGVGGDHAGRGEVLGQRRETRTVRGLPRAARHEHDDRRRRDSGRQVDVGGPTGEVFLGGGRCRAVRGRCRAAGAGALRERRDQRERERGSSRVHDPTVVPPGRGAQGRRSRPDAVRLHRR